MDLLVLLAQLDDTIHNAKPAPLSGHVMIDKDKVGEILDQMRATIPEEIRQGPWIVQDSKERLAAAERMLEEAREAGASSSLAGAAAEQVRGIIEAAERTAADIRSNVERDAREAQRAAEETRRDAEQRATEAGDRAAAEAAALLGQAEEATATTLERARGVESELDGLMGNLHASIGSLVGTVSDGAGSLSTRLEQMRSELSEVGAGTIALGEPGVGGPHDAAADVGAEGQETTPESAYEAPPEEAGTGKLEPSEAVEPGPAQDPAAGGGGAAPFDFERVGSEQPAAAHRGRASRGRG